MAHSKAELIQFTIEHFQSSCNVAIDEEMAADIVLNLVEYSSVLLEIDTDLRAKAVKDREVSR